MNEINLKESVIDHASQLKVNDTIKWVSNQGTEYISVIKELDHLSGIDRWHLKLDNNGWIPWCNMNKVRRITLPSPCMVDLDKAANVYAKLYEALIAADNMSYKPNNQQPTMKTNLQTKTDYIIGSIAENGQYSFSKEPRSHATEQSATTEAHHLASTVATDKQFVVFKRTLTPVKSALKVPQQSEWL